MVCKSINTFVFEAANPGIVKTQTVANGAFTEFIAVFKMVVHVTIFDLDVTEHSHDGRHLSKTVVHT